MTNLYETLSIVHEWLEKTDAIKPDHDISSIRKLVRDAIKNATNDLDIREACYNSEYYHQLSNDKNYTPFAVSIDDKSKEVIIYFKNR